MATLKYLLDVAAPDAQKTFDRIGVRLTELDRSLNRAREIGLGDASAKATLTRLQLQADKFGDKLKGMDLTIDGAAKAEAQLLGLEATADRLNRKLSSEGNVFSRAFSGMSKSSFAQPSGMGVAAGLSPALIPLAGGIATAIGAIGISLGAATIGAGAFGLLAKSALTTAGTAATAVEKAQETYNAAIATGTKHATAYAAEQRAIKLAYAGLSPAQIALSKQVGDLQNAWDGVQHSLAPVVSGALVPWLHAVTDAMQLIKPFVTPIAAVFKDWGQSLNRYFSNTIVAEQLRQLAVSFGKFSASQLRDIGHFLVDIGAAVFHLGEDLTAGGVNWGAFGDHLKAWGKAFDTWSKSQKARDDVQGFLRYLHQEGPVVKGILTDLGKILPGIFKGVSTTGTLELQAVAGFLGLIANLPKGWQAPLTEAAGALLLLSKTGVVKVGLKLTGKLAEHPTALGFSIGTLLAAGIIEAVNQHKPGEKSIWQRFSPPPKGQQQTWLNSWSGLGDRIVQIADDARHGVAWAWDHLWNHTLAVTKQGAHDNAVEFDQLRHGTATTFDMIRHDVASAWDRIWSDTVTRVKNGISDVIGWFKSLPGRALGALRGLGHSLYGFAHSALSDFLNGLKSVGGTVLGWLKNFIGGIPSAIMRFLHMSPPHAGSVFYDLGANIMHHLASGIKATAHQAVSAATAVARRVSAAGSGVQRWAGLVSQALRMEGLSPGLLGNVLYQMQTESGGNPNAINLNDINAQMGDPSRGLLQVIESTFQAYHWPGTSNNIYDPLANIAAALNYARHVYGPSLMSGGMGIGSGHGYAAGSWNVPYTGPAVVHQGEMIIPAAAAAAVRAGGGGVVNNYVTVNVPVSANPRETARQIAEVLNQGATAGIKLRTSILGPG
jgi:hypothetical protein